ncbi:tRNA (N(6)-L-threonylcarbamoyladenosine(37)-C(2))-methylthiotransferase MtaB [uncultured Eubacterium sp.]|uniref:tRNA (N(6)-L-threonylcarbamoyladenosine(37)-C(2))- methylthiotransferase MtaB n=1 Tax=uncultured Eubacterium sp. TaxID=165185 RepID=UPI00260D6869|nr:tRNA (N(6)-L-threonylcarbamoyladenosine(37)-C(2))-methylthiotransferase MtaB [uncultured Eubacterium sp.]
MRKAALHNLGCKVNSYETDAMAQLLEKAGYEIVPFSEIADVYIVNTCSVTNMADRKSRQMLHKAKKQNPDAVVVATGCYVQTAVDKVKEDLAIDIIIGNNKKKEVVPILEEYFKENEKDFVIDINNTSEYEDLEIPTVTEHTRAHMKIQDGCNNFCSYCIIPYARGRIRSRKMDSIREEMVRLAEKGFKEIVLTGINLGCYSDGEKTLIDVIEMADEIEGIERVRLGSLDPEVITPDFVERIGKCRKICPHFHLSLQSGCNNTLKAMNRHYTAEEYFEKCEMLRSVFENPAFTTDIIVGFPGESDEDFEASLDFAKKVEFSRIHVFKYSKRDGTVAAKMPNQVDERIKTKRSDILIATGEELVKKYNENKLGTYDFVLWEERKQINGREYWVGHTTDYVEVALETDEELAGKIQKVALKDIINQEIILATQ